LESLKIAQNQVIQSEKLASLGELTAGIAHEIQNPLNFVNNFSSLNQELAQELDEELAKPQLSEGIIRGLLESIQQNQQKISFHGERASSIVRGMLDHSKNSTGVKEIINLEKLADEYLRLSFHGLRAKNKSFNAKYDLEVRAENTQVKAIPQDLGRVLLNLITNAFYASTHRKNPEPEHQPEVKVKIVENKDSYIVSIADNGDGIAPENMEKIFQPFFTTKPTGEGTGLGLSLAYDIVTKSHNGKLNVLKNEPRGALFQITLPKNLA
jgi:two-component system, NtrC family, sensor kinase